MSSVTGASHLADGQLTHTRVRLVGDYPSMTPNVIVPLICERCERPAEFDTPIGLLCREHTHKLLQANPTLWTPELIEEPSDTED
jgi:hypothetical protein